MGSVDVDRYTGSCLISTAIRGKFVVKRSDEKCDADSSNVVTYRQLKARNVAAAATTTTTTTPALAPNDPRNWAGVPLVSMAASIRKSGPANKNKTTHYNQANNCSRPVSIHGHNWRVSHAAAAAEAASIYNMDAAAAAAAAGGNGFIAGSLASMQHSLQGAPLIRVPRGPINKLNGFLKKRHSDFVVMAPIYQHHQHQQQQQQFQQHLQQQQHQQHQQNHHTPAASSHQTHYASHHSTSFAELCDSPDGSSSCSLSSDSLSVTSDEGPASAGSETNLPRIIKPRKRRKKERGKSALLQPQAASVAPRLDSPIAADYLNMGMGSQEDDLNANEDDDPLAHFSRLTIAPGSLNCWPILDDDGGWNSVWNPAVSPSWSTSSSQVSSRSSASCWPDPLDSASSSSSPSSISPDDASSSADSTTGAAAAAAAGSLEISSQIITSSPYGHRDIEIRLFSSARS